MTNNSTTEDKVKQLIEELRKLSDIDNDNEDDDEETNHRTADQILIDIICELGYPEVEDLFDDIDKWYA